MENPAIRGFVFILLSVLSTTVWLHGGLSALDGLLEIFLLIGLGMIIFLVWLIFALIVLFTKGPTQKLFLRFRNTLFVLVSILFITLGLVSISTQELLFAIWLETAFFTALLWGLSGLIISQKRRQNE
ncbi:hypothetical protein [Marinicella sp. W31]|uniref:hypothetical protein n=1 Tax=Marinicella sp. W31 TaxID=3023713 RepID=UPI003758359D